MNTQKHSAINATPYEVVFGQPVTEGVFPGCDKEAEPMEEDLFEMLDSPLDSPESFAGTNDVISLTVLQ